MRAYTRFTLLTFLALALAGCGEDGPDCFQASGEQVREVLDVPAFTRITVFENIRLVLRHGERQEVVLETGKNLRPDVSARVADGVLELRDRNGCNLFRSYGQTTFYVTTPDLEAVRSSTGWPVESDGALPFSDLRLISESFNDPEAATTDGSFDLEVDAGRVQIVANGIAFFKLRGRAGSLVVTIAAGDARVEAEGLQAGAVQVDHRGSNVIRVNPLNRIAGVIRGYGDVLSFNRPAEVAVEELFRGRLIFVD
ncbi:head GIN domain-containing protein [Robiginitalea marina]|uniref:DUF2807 domain-containing protein n=1 Tax=Robiginitalea marina TaxID=2954105 RepID=A0ABT1AYI1_9FLAO|nr:head GIN domain-containing protein [Robiginitalea marina]MCO5724717.1 DUF2807 domain-containing protein [Robiginitalea marina]